jgi:hypothetical protein
MICSVSTHARTHTLTTAVGRPIRLTPAGLFLDHIDGSEPLSLFIEVAFMLRTLNSSMPESLRVDSQRCFPLDAWAATADGPPPHALNLCPRMRSEAKPTAPAGVDPSFGLS